MLSRGGGLSIQLKIKCKRLCSKINISSTVLFICIILFFKKRGSGEMAQRFRAQVALSEDQGWIPSIYTADYKHVKH